MDNPLGMTDQMEALFSAESRLQAMAAFESALAGALAESGLVPPEAAEAIARTCAEWPGDPEVFRTARQAGNAAIPFVRELTARVRHHSSEAARWVHFAATSQDVIDSATMLLANRGLGVLLADLDRLRRQLAELASRHAGTSMIGRTLLQQALPVTFGYKAAVWLDGLDRSFRRLTRLRTESVALQFGGPVGTLDKLGDKGPAVAAALAARLSLPCPGLAWHTSRGRIAEIGAELGMLAGGLGKIGRDLILAMQSEIGELAEPAAEGKGGSSSMPHKRNPVGSLFAVAAAIEAPHQVGALLSCMVQEHERAAGAWHAEWPLLPRLFGLAHAALLSILEAVEGLEVNASAMAGHLAGAPAAAPETAAAAERLVESFLDSRQEKDPS